MAAPAFTTLIGPLTSPPEKPEENAEENEFHVAFVNFTVCSTPMRTALTGSVARVITTSLTRALIPIPMVPLLLPAVVGGVLRGFVERVFEIVMCGC